MTAPLVSAIIASFNRAPELREALSSVFAQEYPAVEVLVVDNGSSDGSAEMVEKEFPAAVLMRLKKNLGSSAGRNHALESAHGKYVFQIDSDATIEPRTAFSSMAERFEKEDDLGIIFTRIEDPVTGRAYRQGYGDRYLDREFYTWRFHGCAAMIRREAIAAAGYYLPEEFFRAGEENDLSVRVLDAGYNILYMPGTIAHHKLSPKERDRGEIMFLNVRNNIRVAWKHYPLLRALAVTAWRPLHYLAVRLGKGDLGGIPHFFGIIAGQLDAVRRRKPMARRTLEVIDALTIEPALTVEAMRALRAKAPRVKLTDLVLRRLGGRPR
jgi:GT2 family glycosyltransferase